MSGHRIEQWTENQSSNATQSKDVFALSKVSWSAMLHCSPPGDERPLNKGQAVWATREAGDYTSCQTGTSSGLFFCQSQTLLKGKKKLFIEQRLPLFYIVTERALKYNQKKGQHCFGGLCFGGGSATDVGLLLYMFPEVNFPGSCLLHIRQYFPEGKEMN